MLCPHCGANVQDGAAFCSNCGAPMAEQPVKPQNGDVCTKCGASFAPGQSFCTNCGAPRASTDEATQARTAVIGSEPLATGGASAQPADVATPANMAANPAGAPTPKRRAPLIIVIVSAAAAAAAVLVAIFVVGPMLSPQAAVSPETSSITQSQDAGSSSDDAVSDDDKATRSEDGAKSNDSSGSTSGSSSKSSSSSSSSSSTQSSDYVLPESNSRYYSDAELNKLSDYELFIARNEIFARYGRGFKNQTLATYFAGKSWYHKRYSPEEFEAMESPLNDYERKNADAIKAIEVQRNSSYLS